MIRLSRLTKGLFCQEGDGLDAGDVKTLPASQVLAGSLIVEEQHIALGFGKLGAIALVAAAGHAVLLLSKQPAQFVGIGGAAERAIQLRRLGGLRFIEKSPFIHNVTSHYLRSRIGYRPSMGTQGCPSGLPRYSARGRIRRLLVYCSRMCAVQPD